MTGPTRSATPRRRSPKRQRPAEEAAERREAARRSRRRNYTIAAAVVGVVAVAAVALALAASRGGDSGQVTAGGPTSTTPAAFDLPALTGSGDVTLTQFRGRPVVVNFFASWCTACQGELPGFSTVSRELAGRVTFVGVTSEETGDGLAMARQFGIALWPLARDVGGEMNSGLHDALGGLGMPITAFYDSGGKLLYVSPGALPESQLRSRIRDLFGIG